MRHTSKLAVLGLLIIAAAGCKDLKKEASGASPDAAASPVDSAAAAQAAEKPSREAFEANRAEFEVCDKKRLRSIALMSSKSASERSEATTKLGESRECLNGWWEKIEKILAKQAIPKDVWMKHYVVWKDEPKKFPLPTGKPIEGGRSVSLAGTSANDKITLTLPTSWKRAPEKKKPKERADFDADGLHAFIINEFVSGAHSAEDDFAYSRSSESSVFTKQHVVDGVNGVLDVYKYSDKQTSITWRAYRQIDSDEWGRRTSVTIDFPGVSKLSDEQLQLFFDVLASLKFAKK